MPTFRAGLLLLSMGLIAPLTSPTAAQPNDPVQELLRQARSDEVREMAKQARMKIAWKAEQLARLKALELRLVESGADAETASEMVSEMRRTFVDRGEEPRSDRSQPICEPSEMTRENALSLAESIKRFYRLQAEQMVTLRETNGRTGCGACGEGFSDCLEVADGIFDECVDSGNPFSFCVDLFRAMFGTCLDFLDQCFASCAI